MKASIWTGIGLLLSVCAGCRQDPALLLRQQADRTRTPLYRGWEFRQAGSDRWRRATVPGTVHTDLLAAGAIDNPYFSDNEKKLRWIGKADWEYRTVFVPAPRQWQAAESFLEFEGLDTYADVYLNDSLILQADNMFRRWRIPVKGLLRRDSNELRVLFRSADRPSPVPEAKAQGPDSVRRKDAPVRKASYHFGEGGGPRFVTAGIWKPVWLDSYNRAAIEDVHCLQREANDSLAAFDLTVRVASAVEGPAVLSAVDSAGKPYFRMPVELSRGTNVFYHSLEIPFPRLWWPNGMGEAVLYPVHVILSAEGAKLDQEDRRLGVRTVELRRDTAGNGAGFRIMVNGEPLFVKGAELVPLDMFLPNVSRGRYRRMVEAAADNHLNLLRVWKGGLYEGDNFYDACDEHGILVWQDLPVPASFPFSDDSFAESVREEVRQNVVRLRNHPSLLLWGGPPSGDPRKDSPGTLPAGPALARIIAREDPQREYRPEKPFPEKEPASGISAPAQKEVPSPANYDTWAMALKPSERRLRSEALRSRQQEEGGLARLESRMADHLPVLKHDLRTFVYLSQLLQAEQTAETIESRRRTPDRSRNGDTLYGRFNDCWPAVSSSGIDYPFGFKAAYYYARRSLLPVLLSFRVKSDTAILYAVSERPRPVLKTVRLSLTDFSGAVIWEKDTSVTVPARGKLKVAVLPLREILGGRDRATVVLTARSADGGEVLRAVKYLAPLKALKLPEPDFTVRYRENGRNIIATIRANNLLKGVVFETCVPQDNPSDAYFDLLPGERRTVRLRFREEYPVEETDLRVRTLNDILRHPYEYGE